jgi:8-oxo-dGTP pyrophosphatase MutT (NUDIX family)
MIVVPDLAQIRAALAAREPQHATGPEIERRAAVATILRNHHEPEVLLIRRAEHPVDPWSGHMAFPGGRHERDDRDLLHTALRETLEEVGLDLSTQARLVGRLDDIPAIARGLRTGMAIAPFVFELEDGGATVSPNYEVQEIVWAKLAPLLRGEADTTFPYLREGEAWHLPAFDVGGRIVWGLTYQMLQHLFFVVRSYPSQG